MACLRRETIGYAQQPSRHLHVQRNLDVPGTSIPLRSQLIATGRMSSLKHRLVESMCGSYCTKLKPLHMHVNIRSLKT